MGWEKRRIGELVDHYYYSVAFGERWMDGYRHLSTSVSSSSNSSEVRIPSTTLHYTTLHLHTRGKEARQKSKVDLQTAAAKASYIQILPGIISFYSFHDKSIR